MNRVRGFVAVTSAFATLVAPMSALAQCKADVDCKGNRICEGGTCVDPNDRAPERKVEETDDGVTVTYSGRAEAPPPVMGASTGWALPAGIIGFIGAAAVLSLAVGSELTSEDQIPSLPLGAAATVLVAALGPVTFAGAKSARSETVTGLLGMRIVGWVTYGVSLANALVLLLFGVVEVTPPDGYITAVGVLGALSLTSFAIDAVAGYSEASSLAATDSGWGPSLGFARDSTGHRLPTLGAAARF